MSYALRSVLSFFLAAISAADLPSRPRVCRLPPACASTLGQLTRTRLPQRNAGAAGQGEEPDLLLVGALSGVGLGNRHNSPISTSFSAVLLSIDSTHLPLLPSPLLPLHTLLHLPPLGQRVADRSTWVCRRPQAT
ncbi:uncharacterized protein RHOBADRAFT_66867 [Rhodotorula graminis WP1]|uniref:Secreted protein n=1 Tax=Rhodotorula graminis (strain WP1) TaxID=578459 RepID=A0A0N8PZN3_RHOGW|nr:uncharacterized protein RHOBADRAFT_66867 [Rhodotorula graminis WP1]KPV72805.1 hypothetical protein RHOBADRAFT_66867 [Rhodotorula graminis WP1]